MYRISINRIIGALFIAALAVFLVTSNVRLALNSLPLYEYGFHHYEVDAATGLSLGQLSEAGRHLRDYFNSSDQLLDVHVTIDSTTRSLFVEREILHMRDVKDLVWKVYRVQEGAFVYLFLFVTMGFFILGSNFGGRVRRLFITGSILTLLIVGAVAVASVLAFGPLFLLFHFVSFSNDLWQLDPSSSYLLRMFPDGFWRDATLLIGAASVAEALGIMLLLAVMEWWHRWRLRIARRKAPQFG
ncbi:MAG: DUF1461 domain-containing protein [Dehalococcoidia bacterium]|nr:DUF1461 domain-containing protein [Dehalococcoidia bacterium]